jgi:soluble lytic murein transglycosylase-like protein
MASTISIHDLIYNQALQQGIDPAVALAVAQRESGTSQWRADGSVVRGSSGEYGVFQIMPETARGLGVDPDSLSDVNVNIRTGVSFLAQLYAKYGDWSKALAAYNSGSPNSKSPGVLGYVASVLGLAQNYAPALTQVATAGGPSAGLSVSDILGSVTNGGNNTLLIGGLLLGAGVLAWWLSD